MLLSLAAVYIVPGSLGCGSVVLAAIIMLAPSFAAFKAIALPIPRLPPVMNNVRPSNFLNDQHVYFINNRFQKYMIIHFLKS